MQRFSFITLFLVVVAFFGCAESEQHPIKALQVEFVNGGYVCGVDPDHNFFCGCANTLSQQIFQPLPHWQGQVEEFNFAVVPVGSINGLVRLRDNSVLHVRMSLKGLDSRQTCTLNTRHYSPDILEAKVIPDLTAQRLFRNGRYLSCLSTTDHRVFCTVDNHPQEALPSYLFGITAPEFTSQWPDGVAGLPWATGVLDFAHFCGVFPSRNRDASGEVRCRIPQKVKKKPDAFSAEFTGRFFDVTLPVNDVIAVNQPGFYNEPSNGISDVTAAASLPGIINIIDRNGQLWTTDFRAFPEHSNSFNDILPITQPEPVPGLTGVKLVRTNALITCAIFGVGEIICWLAGENEKAIPPHKLTDISDAIDLALDNYKGLCYIDRQHYVHCLEFQ